MRIIDTKIPDVKIIEPTVFGDDRGYFFESFKDDWFRKNVKNVTFVQENQSYSQKNILRGLHYQVNNTQGKLVRLTSGKVFDVAVDMRKDSLTYGQWVGEVLSCENKRQLWIPEGFAHGFLVLSDEAEFVYKCTNYYDPSSEVSIRFDDPTLSIEWPTSNSQFILSQKDLNGLAFNQSPTL